ncbi:DUF4062 domain-containing protein [Geoalkalibacter halelectricus]|uniref:DUF4062 domain-containing protein n=1 Tax=Geoalkalibacter halelectricus TaxID=2847045 RepID=UPI003D261D63
MSSNSKLRIMISSRCEVTFPSTTDGQLLSELRKELKADIENFKVFEKQIFEVWINESTPPKGGIRDSWEECLQAVKDCDIFISIFDGNAGWAKEGGEVGICHAELMTALGMAPGKVRIIQIEGVSTVGDITDQRNTRFQDYIKTQSLFRGRTVKTVSELKTRVKEAIYDALIGLTHAGVREASKGRFCSGQALDWTRLDFRERREQMRRVLHDAVQGRKGSKIYNGHLIITLAAEKVVVVADAIPAAMSIGAAKEMVGQPFLRDHEVSGLPKGCGGPMHIIACHKTTTESQAIKFLGFPDATVVTAPFGIFVADNFQKVQFVFITNCRDETTTRHGVQRFFEWLKQTGEDVLVAKRAKARARIVAAVAKEIGED